MHMCKGWPIKIVYRNTNIDPITGTKEAWEIKQNGASPNPWPIIERDGPFGYQMYDVLLDGNIKQVPIIIGFTSEEWLFAALEPNNKEIAAYFDENPSELLGKECNMSKENRTTAGVLLKKIYTNTSFREDEGAYIRYISDMRMSINITKQAELHSKYADVYLYQFSYKGPLGGLMDLPVIPGAGIVAHSEDLWYIWEQVTKSDISTFPAKDRLMFQRYTKLWTNFVKYHNPTPGEDQLLQNITWTKVDHKNPSNIQYLNINEIMEMQANPRYWGKIKKLVDYYITPDIII